MRLEAVRFETRVSALLATGSCCCLLALRQVKVEADWPALGVFPNCTLDASGGITEP